MKFDLMEKKSKMAIYKRRFLHWYNSDYNSEHMERLSVIRTIRSLTLIKIAMLNHFIIAIVFEMKANFFIFNCNDKMIEQSDFDES